MMGVYSKGARCNPGGCAPEVVNREGLSFQKTWMLLK